MNKIVHTRPIGVATDARAADKLAGWLRDGAPVSMIEVVIGRSIGSLLPAPQVAVRRYALGLVTGAITESANIDHCDRVPAVLGYTNFAELGGDSWVSDIEYWQDGIRLLHGLAYGVIDYEPGDEPYGTETDLRAQWYLRAFDLTDADLTPADVAAAFDGDVLAAAEAVHASRRIRC